jgi:plasmid stabilization system protein ParE
MAPKKLFIKWSDDAIWDLKGIYHELLKTNSKDISLGIRNEIFFASRGIVFPEQYQVDDIYTKYRRIVIRNYKVLYIAKKDTIHITMVVDSRRNPY